MVLEGAEGFNAHNKGLGSDFEHGSSERIKLSC